MTLISSRASNAIDCSIAQRVAKSRLVELGREHTARIGTASARRYDDEEPLPFECVCSSAEAELAEAPAGNGGASAHASGGLPQTSQMAGDVASWFASRGFRASCGCLLHAAWHAARMACMDEGAFGEHLVAARHVQGSEPARAAPRLARPAMLATVLPRSIASAELNAAKRVPHRPEQLVAWRGVVAIDQG